MPTNQSHYNPNEERARLTLETFQQILESLQQISTSILTASYEINQLNENMKTFNENVKDLNIVIAQNAPGGLTEVAHMVGKFVKGIKK